MQDYGFSTDEDRERERASIALSAYGVDNQYQIEDYDDIGRNKYYGTVVSMLGVFVNDLVAPRLGLVRNSVWHYLDFSLFLTSFVAIFYLLKLFVSPWTAVWASVLYLTQPLYFGHAFINPKDTPLLSIFVITITLGFYIDQHKTWQPALDTSYSFHSLREDAVRLWRVWGKREQRGILSLLLAGAAALIFKRPIAGLLSRIVVTAYEVPNSLPGRALRTLAQNIAATPADAYANKAITYYGILHTVLLVIIGLALLLLVLRAFIREPDLWQNHPLYKHSCNPYLVLGGIVFGLAISTRTIALAAGGIVTLYLLWQYRGKAIRPLSLYFLMTAIASYLSWPVYWRYGVISMLTSGLGLLSNFKTQAGVPVLFEGKIIPASELPRHYLPKLMALQFTEPLVILALFGLGMWLFRILKQRDFNPQVKKQVLILLWILLPMFYVVLKTPIMYDAFRQFLFITPPLIFFAAAGVEFLKKHLPHSAFVILLLLALLPGLSSLPRLHPYEYFYYNEFVGGVDGAFRSYPLDFWYISTQEAMDYLNEVAPENAVVYVPVWSHHHAELYQRSDLVLPYVRNLDEYAGDPFQYAVAGTQYNLDQTLPANWVPIHTIDIAGATLTVIFEVRPDQ
ncbi:MAG: hypothetical protein JXB38_06830 [Anaerolineales bacterium]|nr:hypothetical protein [Anaerolineales bacterium]